MNNFLFYLALFIGGIFTIYAFLSLLYLAILLIFIGRRAFRYWATANAFALILPIGAVIFPIVYKKRATLYKNRNNVKKSFLYWFWDRYEVNFNDCFYGVYEMFDTFETYPEKLAAFNKLSRFGKFILSYRWNVLRNGQWNFRIYLSRRLADSSIDFNTIKIIKFKGLGSDDPDMEQRKAAALQFRNQSIKGISSVHFDLLNGSKEFRYSFTREIWRFHPFRFKGYRFFSVMLGAGASRYITKSRFFKSLR
jgi:hypothetical protein